MAVRVIRHYASVDIAANGCICPMVIPIFKHERGRHFRFDYVVSTATDSPLVEAPDFNFHCLWVPYDIITTRTGGWPSNDAAWDDLASDLLISVGADGSEFYGGDPKADPVVIPDTDDGSLDNQGSEPIMSGTTPGPTGLTRMFSVETLMRPLMATGSDTVRHFAEGVQTCPGGSQGILLPFIHRYEQDRPNTGFALAAANFDPVGYLSMTAAPTAARLAGALWGGDLQRVQHDLFFSETASINEMKTSMWGGDVRIDSSTPALTNPAYRATVKMWGSIETPYTIFR